METTLDVMQSREILTDLSYHCATLSKLQQTHDSLVIMEAFSHENGVGHTAPLEVKKTP